MSNRTLINSFIIDQLKYINKLVSPFDNSYTFKSDLHTNVFSRLKFIDEINDFPSVYVSSPNEYRKYNTAGNSEALVVTILRVYVYCDEPASELDNIIQDIDHVIYNLRVDTNLKSLDITITDTTTDSGLLAPYGMAEIFLSSRFEI